MFTGIIEEIGIVTSIQIAHQQNDGAKSGTLSVKAKIVLADTKIGDSVAVNGVCLTVISVKNDTLTFDVMSETFRMTNLGLLSTGSAVNLERALSLNDRFGGHIVSGHIDGTGTIVKAQNEGNATWVYVSASSKILNLIIQKGSIAIDGISLTVAKVTEKGFAVSIIPHTATETTLLRKKPGDKVNLENDIIGKYVQKLMQTSIYINSEMDKVKSQEEKDATLLKWLSD